MSARLSVLRIKYREFLIIGMPEGINVMDPAGDDTDMQWAVDLPHGLLNREWAYAGDEITTARRTVSLPESFRVNRVIIRQIIKEDWSQTLAHTTFYNTYIAYEWGPPHPSVLEQKYERAVRVDGSSETTLRYDETHRSVRRALAASEPFLIPPPP